MEKKKMVTLDDSIDVLEEKYNFGEDNFFERGSSAAVYKLEEFSQTPVVAKFLYLDELNNTFDNSHKTVSNLYSEYNIQKELYDSGVNVPKPFGVYYIKNSQDNKYYPGFVMERVEGETFFDLNSEEFDAAVKLTDAELARARELGFNPVDAGVTNAIFNKDKKTIHLIDFEFWAKK